MVFIYDVIEELNLLLKFFVESLMQGFKIYYDVSQVIVEVVFRFYIKGLIIQVDGGYFIDFGVDVVEYIRCINSVMSIKFNQVFFLVVDNFCIDIGCYQDLLCIFLFVFLCLFLFVCCYLC